MDALLDWDETPLSFDEAPPPPAQPRKPAPSRSSTGFSALTMQSSDDPPLDFSDTASVSSQEQEMNVDESDLEEDSTTADEDDEEGLSTSDEDAWCTDEELPELSYSSDAGAEEDSSQLELATPRRGLSTSSDNFSLFDEVDHPEEPFGQDRAPGARTTSLVINQQEVFQERPKLVQPYSDDAEMLDIEDILEREQPRFRPPPRKRHKSLHSDTMSSKTPEATVSAGTTVPRADPAVALSTRPRSPTQAEMDAFFGFIAPAIQIDPQLLAVRSSGDNKPGEQADAADQIAVKAVQEQPAKERTALARTQESPQSEQPEVPATPTSQQPPARRPYFQLAPIPAESPSTGQALTLAEKNSYIRTALERVGLSVLQQIADNVLPPVRPEGGDPTEEHRKPRPSKGDSQTASSTQRIVVVLAKRGGKDRSDSRQQCIKYPRKYGKGEGARLGGRELAIFLRVVQILLEGLRLGIVSTKRDIYYRDVQLFGKQQVVDTMIEDIAATLRVRRSDLNIVATSKGLFSGALRLVLQDGSTLAGTGRGVLVPQGQSIRWMELDQVRWVLVVEKDAVFSTLIDAELTSDEAIGNGILVTGKGYPDVVTRELVVRLSHVSPKIPLFALVDWDPHGIDIVATYRFGSSALMHNAQDLAAPHLRWLGPKLTDLTANGIGRDKLLPLKRADRLKAHALLKREDIPSEWKRELQQMLRLGCKAETEILSDYAPSRGQSPTDGAAEAALDGLDAFVRRQLRLALQGTT
ncbi:hypothetical protein JCM10908_006034 [Rhodotorula pacifica]|uniref:DNA topoisomerase (ATP-hydrolyzing) n=1 Tax=Rhodotorula pacifica TaxID=1495444 RepID=UPI003171F34A